MTQNYLNSPILPGTEPLQRKDHHVMRVWLGVFVVVLIIVATMSYLRLQTSTDTTPPAVVVDQKTLERQAILAQLKNVEPPTPEQVKAITDQLKKSKTTITSEQRTAIIEQLQAR